MMGGNRYTNMDTIWKDMQETYCALGVENQFGHITISSFVNDPKSPSADFPNMEGKGAQNRHLIPVLCLVFAKYKRDDNTYERMMHKMLQSLEGYYVCCDYRRPDGSYPLSLPNGIVEQMRRHIDDFLIY